MDCCHNKEELAWASKLGLLNVYRWGSPSFFSLIANVRQNLDKVELDQEDQWLLAETDIGEFSEYNGERVPLDCPLESSDNETLSFMVFADESLNEFYYTEGAEYKGRKVELNKPMKGDVKKWKVFVKDPKTGNVKKINFGTSATKAIVSDPKRRASFVARHKCERFSGMGPEKKLKPQYWACVATPKLLGVSARYW